VTAAKPARIAMVEAIYAKVDLRFNDTRSARIHRKEEARSKDRKMVDRFSSPKVETLLPRSAVSLTKLQMPAE
jgi:hypothetical protein